MQHSRSDLPKVSVLMSVFNGAGDLSQVVESILAQTFKNFELVVIDDGSTDDTWKQLIGYAEKDPRIVPVQQANRGLTVALSRGLQLCRGEFVARQDVDDWSDPRRLETLLAAVEADTHLLVSGWSIEVNGKKSHSRIFRLLKWLPNWLSFWIAARVNLFVHGTYFFRKDRALELGGYRELFALAQDYDLLLRFLECGQLRFIPASLYALRLHGGSLSVKKKTLQAFYAVLACMASKARLKTGKDPIAGMQFSENELRAILRRLVRQYPLFAAQVFFLTGVRYRDFQVWKEFFILL